MTATTRRTVGPALAALVTLTSSTFAGDDATESPSVFALYGIEKSRWEAGECVRAALQRPVSVVFDETPMREALESVAEMVGVEIEFDEEAFHAEGCEALLLDPIVLRMDDAPACGVMRAILGPEEILGYDIRDDAVRITTEIEAEESLVTRMYDVRRLIALGIRTEAPIPVEIPAQPSDLPHSVLGPGFGSVSDETPDASASQRPVADLRIIGLDPGQSYDLGYSPDSLVKALTVERQGLSLEEFIYLCTSGPWFNLDGIGGTLRIVEGQLVVRQTERNHEQIRDLLQVLEEVASREPAPRQVPLIGNPDDEAYAALQKRITVDLENVPAFEAAVELTRQAGVPVRLAWRWAVNLPPLQEIPVTLHVENEPLENVLFEFCDILRNGYSVWHGTIRVGDVWEEERIHTLIYDIRDFDRSSWWDVREVIVEESRHPWFERDGVGGRALLCDNGLLLIRHDAAAHAEVTLLLERLREQRATDAFPNPADDEWTTHIYPIENADAIDWLVDAVQTFVRPGSWDANDSEAAIRGGGHTLIIRQTGAGHRDVARLLERIEWAHSYVREHLPGQDQRTDSGQDD